MPKLVIISDTHTQHRKIDLPDGDILIHAGDLEIRDPLYIDEINNWFLEQKKKYKEVIFIGGNHDFELERFYRANLKPPFSKELIYLCNSPAEIEGIKIWGSPFSPVFHQWAFMGFSDELKEIWNTIPEDTDIVITHCPPFGINDQVGYHSMSQGCPALRDRIKEIKPKLHIFGHIHEEGGKIYQDEHTIYINASLLDEYYNLVNEPVVID